MNYNLASNADQNCALKEEELDAVCGGRWSLQDFKDAVGHFARGDIFAGIQSWSNGNNQAPPPPPPSSNYI